MAAQPDVMTSVTSRSGPSFHQRSPNAEPVTETRGAPTSVDAVRKILSLMETPQPLLFAPTIDARLKIDRPFTVRIERSGDVTSAYAAEIEEFGQGRDSGEALYDLGKTIAELYFSLEQQAGVLGPDLQALQAKLQHHIRRVRP